MTTGTMAIPVKMPICIGAACFLPGPESKSDDPNEAAPPAGDPMLGKKAGDVRDDNGVKMKLVWCRPGLFTMEQFGRIEDPPAKNDDTSDDDDGVGPKNEASPEQQQSEEVTSVKVFVTNGYWLGKYEVTQSEWKQVMHAEPWRGRIGTKEGADFPATFVGWQDAIDFCRKLTEQERQAGRLSNDWEYTLPTEAQWERPCRARTESRFSFGDDESKLGEYAWFRDTALKAGEPYAHRVGQKKENRWGLCDMHGNVWEWCRDIHGKLPGGRNPEAKADEKTANAHRVVRGGGWGVPASNCQSGFRAASSPMLRHASSGFRLALSTVQQATPADPGSEGRRALDK
jgi:sulfatase modifying factor 1